MQVKTQSSVSMLLLKAGFCNIALLSDANPGRTKKKNHLGLVMLHFFIKQSADSLRGLV